MITMHCIHLWNYHRIQRLNENMFKKNNHEGRREEESNAAINKGSGR